eukprot:gene9336-11449_t
MISGRNNNNNKRNNLFIIVLVFGLISLIQYIECTDTNKLSPQFGVSPEEVQYYSGKQFNCLRSNKQIPISQVNDDYCDCPDGTDEPGTSACSNGHYFCVNKGYKSESISSSMVNDGVCDCCDGSDEYQKKINCPNTCNELGAELKKQRDADLNKFTEGLKKKSDMENEAKDILIQKKKELDTLNKEIEPLNQEIKELEVKKEKLEKERDEELAKKRELEEAELQKKKESEQQEEKKEEVVNEHKEGEQPEVTQGHFRLLWKFVKTSFSSTSSDNSTNIRDIERQISDKRESLRQKQESIDNIEKLLKMNTGKNNVFLPLFGKCFEYKTKEYTYTHCPFDKASQGHTSLGKWSDWEDGQSIMYYNEGTQCWGGPKRSVKVSLECGQDNEVYDVQEPGKCEYTMKFKTPAACNEEHLKMLHLQGEHNW